MSLTVIDIHPHVISTDEKRYPRAPIGGHQSDWSRDRPVSYEQMIVEQTRAGVAKAALVQASTCYGHDNSYVAEAVAAHPERFTGVFSCDILEPDATATMAKWMGRGLTGMRLFMTGSTMPGQAGWLDDPRSFPAWKLAEDKSLPVCLQMTAQGIPQLRNILDRFPRLRVILDHIGRPQQDGPDILDAAGLLAARDRQAAGEMGKAVSEIMRQLALSSGRFEVALLPVAGGAAYGLEQVEFRIGGLAGNQQLGSTIGGLAAAIKGAIADVRKLA